MIEGEERDQVPGFRWASSSELEPLSQNDAAFLTIAQGSIFGDTTLPSGAVVPGGIWRANGGVLELVENSERTKYSESGFEEVRPGVLRPLHPNDLSFFQMAQEAIIGGAILPSGAQIPTAEAGQCWIIRGEEVHLIDKFEPEKNSKHTTGSGELPLDIQLRSHPETSGKSLWTKFIEYVKGITNRST